MRKNDRAIKKTQRDIERERADLERQEKKLVGNWTGTCCDLSTTVSGSNVSTNYYTKSLLGFPGPVESHEKS